MTTPFLVAGIGNIFLGDDAFGVEVVNALMQHTIIADVRFIDFGISGLNLAYALLDGYNAVIMVDTVKRGNPPGTLYLIEPVPTDLTRLNPSGMIQPHSITPEHVLGMVQLLGGECPRVYLVGCEPESFGCDNDPDLKLSDAVRLAVEPAVERILSLISEIREGRFPNNSN